MCVSKTFQVFQSRVGLWANLQVLDKAGKACHGQTLSFLRTLKNYRHKEFYNIAHNSECNRILGACVAKLFKSGVVS
jgi:hypothetical protein